MLNATELYRTIVGFCLLPLLLEVPVLHDNNLNSKMGEEVDWKNASTIYDFSAKDIDGNMVSLDKYRGHVCIIVNVACK